jgi:glycosyltransferase involved in cell wall biosynthesis
MRKRVLILPSWYPSERFPMSGIFIEDQAVVLAKTYDVAVLYPRLIGYPELLSWRIGPRIQRKEGHGLRVYSERVLAPVPHKSRLAYSIYYRKARQGFEKLLNTWGKPEVIHAHVVLPAGWTAVRLGQEFSIPVVLTEHSGPFSMHLKTDRSQRLVRETLSKVNRMIAVSPFLAKEIRTFHDEVEIEVIGNVIRTDFFKPEEATTEDLPSRTRFLSIASLLKEKGFIYLLEAAQLLNQRGRIPFEVMIGGEGPERDRLRRHVEVSGLSDQCYFLGPMNRSQVRDQMQRCDVFVLPSLQETFGVVLVEAMACGKPVIATRCGGPEFVVTEDTGFLVGVGDSKALADVMERFITHAIRFNPASIRQSICERFGENTFLEKISDIYKGLGIKGA